MFGDVDFHVESAGIARLSGRRLPSRFPHRTIDTQTHWTPSFRSREAAERYNHLLEDSGGIALVPHGPLWSRPAYHLDVVRVHERERLQSKWAAAGMGTGIHYPISIHLSKAYEHLGYGASTLR